MTESQKPERRYLYSAECLEGRVFEGADAIAAALDEGWQESPADIGKEPKPKPKAKAKDDGKEPDNGGGEPPDASK